MRLRRDGLTWQAIGDDIVVLDLQGSVYLRLNGTGRVLWEALAGGASVDEMIERIVVGVRRGGRRRANRRGGVRRGASAARARPTWMMGVGRDGWRLSAVLDRWVCRLRAIPIVLYTLACLVVIEVGVRQLGSSDSAGSPASAS
jgi:hypothetical protein